MQHYKQDISQHTRWIENEIKQPSSLLPKGQLQKDLQLLRECTYMCDPNEVKVTRFPGKPRPNMTPFKALVGL